MKRSQRSAPPATGQRRTGVMAVSGAGASFLLLAAHVAAAQQPAPAGTSAPASACRAATPITTAGEFSGRPISAVDVVTRAPDGLPGPASVVDNLHIRTREATVRRRLLFAAGDTVDTLRVAESVRRLRGLRYLADVGLLAGRCADGSVRLTVLTRDAWSTQPTLKANGSSGGTLGLTESNVLGTGRSAKLYVRSDAGRIGLGAAYSDPWVLGSNLSASIYRNAYRDGASWGGGIATRSRSIFDPWHAELVVGRELRRAPGATWGDTVIRDGAHLLVSHRVSASPRGATALIAGLEYQSAAVSAAPGAMIVGPRTVRRAFAGVDVGATRRTAHYRQNSWLLGGDPARTPANAASSRGIADLPVGFEGEGVVAVGRDFASGRPGLHADLWGGRVWVPGERWVVTTDAWASGYRLGNSWTAGSARAAVGIMHPAARGLWTARIAGEQLTDPDPDVRALATVDPTLRALNTRSGLAETAFAASLERSARLVAVGHGYTLHGALFGAASMRWDPALPGTSSGTDRLYVGAAGLGIRLVPTRFGRATLRLDLGFPLLRSASLPARPFIGFSIVPSFSAGRHRDGSSTP